MFPNTRSLFVWCLAALLEVEAANLPSKPKPIIVSQSPPSNAGIPLDSFVSFSFELSSWPDFAGNLTHPNDFSYNLLNNIGQLQGSMPIARVGGNTQDIAIFDASQKTGLVGVVRPNISADYPTIITIGPSFFDSYKTMPKGMRYTHGFNLGANSSAARAATFASAAYACKAIGDNLAYWEYGNEPDLFVASGYRPLNYSDADYVAEWLNGTSHIEQVIQQACPSLQDTKFMAPSMAGVGANGYMTLDPVKVFAEDLNADNNIGIISSHNYMGVSTSPGITLQGTLMNHTNVIAKAQAQVNVSRNIAALGENLAPKVPFILGEHNSLARQGRPGLSNTFGAALWGVDWNLYLASQNISRSHMHQGTNYRYQSWQPIQTNLTSKGTKPPYYGNLAVAAMMAKPSASSVLQITHLEASSQNTSFYTAHINSTLSRILIVDLHTYNTTANNYTTEFPRPIVEHEFMLPKGCTGGEVQRLMANGSDAVTGITWDAKSYAYELDHGKGVRLSNVTCSEKVEADGKGVVKVQVPWSSAAIINLEC
ncbi:glycoside hydrolase family 79 protein, partial [Aureobasidium melanogenum]